MIGSLNDWQQERQFKVLNEKKEKRGLKVIRGSRSTVIDSKDILVGDIVSYGPGEILPCDGVLLSGCNVKCDESESTGISDEANKALYDNCIALRSMTSNLDGATGSRTHTDCFMISGSKVLEGHGQYVVVAVGTNSVNGRNIMMGSSFFIPLGLFLTINFYSLQERCTGFCFADQVKPARQSDR